MALRSKEELIAAINQRLGETPTDEDLALLEDVADSFDDLTQRANGSGEWEQKYKDLDKNWRDKYRARFLSGTGDDDGKLNDDPDDAPDEKPLTYESLFKTEEK